MVVYIMLQFFVVGFQVLERQVKVDVVIRKGGPLDKMMLITSEGSLEE